jgi:tetratricopeptide (TPR) repeat protein
MARPELLDERPTWGGGKLNASNLLLEPLAPKETSELIAALSEGTGEELRKRILEAAGGNPLFVEEMVAIAQEGGEVAVPPTIQALLAARIDQLDPAERDVLERGAIEGQVFHRGAVLAFAPGEQVDRQLITLVRKDLVRPERALLPGDDAYRFRHLLIRDTAYDGLPKATRAELHERFATWLEEHGADLVELDEILGYHLEQAYRYRAELGPLDNPAAVIAERAATRLLAGADRALERGDTSATVRLLSRATALMPQTDTRRQLAELELATALGEQGELEGAIGRLTKIATAAREHGDVRVVERARIVRLWFDMQTVPELRMTDVLAEAQEALAALERIGDDEGAMLALRLIGAVTGWLGNSAEAQVHWRRALERAEHAGNRFVSDILSWMLLGGWWGRAPAPEAIRLAEEALARSSSKRLEAYAHVVGGAAFAVSGRLDEGREKIAAGRALFQDLGDIMAWAGIAALVAEVELVAGEPQRAHDELSAAAVALAVSSETGYRATTLSFQAHAALDLGRRDEAAQLAGEALSIAAADDFDPHARSNYVLARMAAQTGNDAEAKRLLAAASALVEPTDFMSLHFDLALARADVAHHAGRDVEAREALQHALALAEQKESVLGADRARQELASLEG